MCGENLVRSDELRGNGGSQKTFLGGFAPQLEPTRCQLTSGERHLVPKVEYSRVTASDPHEGQGGAGAVELETSSSNLDSQASQLYS